MSTKGQFTLPKEVRQSLKLVPGCTVEGTVDAEGRLILIPALHEPEELFEGRPKARRALSVDEMNEAIGRAASRGRV